MNQVRPQMLERTRTGALGLLLALSVLGPSGSAAADESTVFTFVGGGWGHSVGLSQYGAFGMSREGFTADQIISHYYTGTTVQPVFAGFAGPLWVNVKTSGSSSFMVEAIAAPGVPVVLSNGSASVSVQPGQTFTVASNGDGTCLLTAPAGNLDGPCTFDGEWDGWEASPTTLVRIPACANTSGPQCRFARGSLRIRPHTDPTKFNVSLEIDVEDYLLGIAEMPYSWGNSGGMAALESQAIAARSYALRTAFDRGAPANRPSCWCHVSATTADQSYVGYGYGAQTWIDAVHNTAGEVVTHPNHTSGGNLLPIKAFYASSTYGWTESYADGFGGGVDQAHLQPVDDHWSADPDLNPNARWSKVITAGELAGILLTRTRVSLTSVTGATVAKCSDSGAALEIRFFGGGNSVTVKTRDLKGWLGLKSMQIHSVGAPPPVTPPCPSPIGDLPQGSLPGDLIESIGLHDVSTGIFRLHVPGDGVLDFYYGNPADAPFAGDWDCDGVTSLGLYRVSAGYLFLRNTNTQGIADIEIYYGIPGDRPLAGDWDGDACDTIGIYRPSEARFYLRNTNVQGVADVSFVFGIPGDQPLAGDWDGDGISTVGVYRPSTRVLYLTNSPAGGVADFSYAYDSAQALDRVIVGDWDGDGVDTVGLYRPAIATFYLRDDFVGGSDYIFVFGTPQLAPVVGRWQN
jgi:SpoIID/LytB domain protein